MKSIIVLAFLLMACGSAQTSKTHANRFDFPTDYNPRGAFPRDPQREFRDPQINLAPPPATLMDDRDPGMMNPSSLEGPMPPREDNCPSPNNLN